MATYAGRWLNEPTLGRFPQRLQRILNSRQFVKFTFRFPDFEYEDDDGGVFYFNPITKITRSITNSSTMVISSQTITRLFWSCLRIW